MPLDQPPPQDGRAAAIRLFALAPWDHFDSLTKNFVATPFDMVRAPETGLVMLRGRMGSTGAGFNLGEATVTRCSVRLAHGTEGHAYVMGRNAEHARRAALCDALYQDEPARFSVVMQSIAALLDRGRKETATKVAATKVDFFTMVRGDD